MKTWSNGEKAVFCILVRASAVVAGMVSFAKDSEADGLQHNNVAVTVSVYIASLAIHGLFFSFTV
jgi:hypothetical protein